MFLKKNFFYVLKKILCYVYIYTYRECVYTHIECVNDIHKKY